MVVYELSIITEITLINMINNVAVLEVMWGFDDASLDEVMSIALKC